MLLLLLYQIVRMLYYKALLFAIVMSLRAEFVVCVEGRPPAADP